MRQAWRGGGSGSSFSWREMPCARRRSSACPPSASSSSASRSRSDAGRFTDAMSHRPRILLVDDETAIQKSVGPLLRSRGYDVEIAGTGAEALTMIRERTPDLIVLDLGLPDLEGTEVCRRVRATSTVPIVVLSARGAE